MGIISEYMHKTLEFAGEVGSPICCRIFPCQLAVEEAQKSNACWVVLDSYECSSSYKNRSQGGVQIPNEN